MVRVCFKNEIIILFLAVVTLAASCCAPTSEIRTQKQSPQATVVNAEASPSFLNTEERLSSPTSTSSDKQTTRPTDAYPNGQTAVPTSSSTNEQPPSTGLTITFENHPFPVDMERQMNSIELMKEASGYTDYECRALLCILDSLRYEFNWITFSDFTEVTMIKNPHSVGNILRVVGDDGLRYDLHVSTSAGSVLHMICTAEGNILFRLIM